MQAGKVDAPSGCKVCGANLSDDSAETCGSICAGTLKHRRFMQALIGTAPGDRAILQHRDNEIVDVLVLRLVHGYFNIQAIGGLDDIARIRNKIASGRVESCGPSCPGWAVFNADSAPVLDVCIECWSGAADPLTLDEVEALPEAEHELALAVAAAEVETDSETLLYKHPLVSPLACECGCLVFQVEGGREKCSACGVVRLHECHCAVPGSCEICKTPSLLDTCLALVNALRQADGRGAREFAGLVEEAEEIIALYEEAAPSQHALDELAETLHAAADTSDNMKYVNEARQLVSTMRASSLADLLQAQGFEARALAAKTVARLEPRTVIVENVPPAPPLGRDEPIFRAVLDAMDRAEEINGPEGDDYRRLMQAIEDEARSRRTTFEKEERP